MKVSHLYIAQVKQKHGIIERENYNKPKSENFRQPKCPPEKEVAITEALKYYGMFKNAVVICILISKFVVLMHN